MKSFGVFDNRMVTHVTVSQIGGREKIYKRAHGLEAILQDIGGSSTLRHLYYDDVGVFKKKSRE